MKKFVVCVLPVLSALLFGAAEREVFSFPENVVQTVRSNKYWTSRCDVSRKNNASNVDASMCMIESCEPELVACSVVSNGVFAYVGYFGDGVAVLKSIPDVIDVLSLDGNVAIDKLLSNPNIRYLSANLQAVKDIGVIENLVSSFRGLVAVQLQVDAMEDVGKFQLDVSMLTRLKRLKDIYIDSYVPLVNVESLRSMKELENVCVRYHTHMMPFEVHDPASDGDVHSLSAVNHLIDPVLLSASDSSIEELNLQGNFDFSNIVGKLNPRIVRWRSDQMNARTWNALPKDVFACLEDFEAAFAFEDVSCELDLACLAQARRLRQFDLRLKGVFPKNLSKLYRIDSLEVCCVEILWHKKGKKGRDK